VSRVSGVVVQSRFPADESHDYYDRALITIVMIALTCLHSSACAVANANGGFRSELHRQKMTLAVLDGLVIFAKQS